MNNEQPSTPSFPERYETILKEYDLTPKALSDRMGEPIAKFYKWMKGVKPRPEILTKMLEVLPDLSENYLRHGVGLVKVARTTPALLAGQPRLVIDYDQRIEALEKINDALLTENTELKKENSALSATVEGLEKQVASLSLDMRHMVDQMANIAMNSFLTPSNHTPVLVDGPVAPPSFDERELAGFKQAQVEKDRTRPFSMVYVNRARVQSMPIRRLASGY